MTETQKQLRKAKREQQKREREIRDRKFIANLTRAGLPPPRKEFRFYPERLFKADFAYPELKLLIEIEGGIFTGQAHGSVSGILRDIEKYNLAAMEGYCVYRILNKDTLSTRTTQAIVRLYARRSKEIKFIDNQTEQAKWKQSAK
ncbi:MAG: hypothetical protein ACLFQX_04010 [Candidatus Kapaibacterium sp.]